MHTLETEIATPEASRYLQQLCKHWSHKFAVSFSPNEGRVPFSETSVCVMAASAETLTLRIEADEPATAARLAEVVFTHLQRFAFRAPLAPPSWRAV